MCTAYELGKRGGSFPDWVKKDAIDVLLKLERRIIRPTLVAPVIMPEGDIVDMNWGFRRAFAPRAKGAKPVWRSIVNSREDKLGGRTWKDAFMNRRCLIPAAAFYEWVVVNGKNTPLRFERTVDEMTWIAAIWEETPEDGKRFSMITTEPNEFTTAVHDRMPAVLRDAQIIPFLAGELNEFGPTVVELKYSAAENFLKPNAIDPPTRQGELF